VLARVKRNCSSSLIYDFKVWSIQYLYCIDGNDDSELFKIQLIVLSKEGTVQFNEVWLYHLR